MLKEDIERIGKIMGEQAKEKKDDLIYVDHSTLSTFATCNEKGRLGYVEHYRPIQEAPPLVFGGAFHAAVAAYYISTTNGLSIEDAKQEARLAFLNDIKEKGPTSLPISADSDERRSVERGIYLIEAYIDKWRASDINWEDVLRPDTREPYIEIGFAVYFMEWHGRPVVYVGKIDRIRRSRVDGNRYIWETKTTSSNVSHFINQIRPNHQLTGYKWACQQLMDMDIAGMIYDAIYVSDRKVGGKFPLGIDSEKDFARVETRRSTTDVDEFLFDLKLITRQFLSLKDINYPRWYRNAPAACFMYGGCHFREACSSNLNPSIMRNKYKIERWEPWKDVKEVVKK